MTKWSNVFMGCVLSIALTFPYAWAEVLKVGNFSVLESSQDFPQQWEPLTFPKIGNHSRYSLIKGPGQTVIKAQSDRSASGMIRRLRINPQQYPILEWSWKIDAVLDKGDVTRKAGDDYPARIYIAFELDPETASWWQRLQHKTASLAAGKELPGTALNYIWANKAPVGTFVPNPYSQEVIMVVVQSGNLKSGQWVSQSRNLVDDYRKAFGRQPPDIIGIALMTDTDNTGEQATAYYGDIILKSK
jgi:hypothetical protein